VYRAVTTLIGVALAGFLFWVGAKIVDPFDESSTRGSYWGWIAMLAAAGLVVALSQLLGGWTKWGWPRFSIPVLLVAFLPGFLAGLWVLFFHEPGSDWIARHVRSWSDDVGLETLVAELGTAVPAIGFGLGLLFGLTFDTTGPRVERAELADGRPAVPEGPPVAGAGYAEQAAPASETPPPPGDR
jgi:hypothetical protein